IVLVLLLLYGERSKALSLSLFGAIFGLLSLWMASALFPWDALQTLGGVIARLVSALQYPTRLLEVSTLFLCLCAGGVYVHLEQRGDGKSALYFGGCSAAAAILLSTMFLNGLLETSPLYRIYDAHAMGNAYLSGREYLPVGTDENALLAGTYTCEDGVDMTETLKQGTTIVMQVENTANDARAIEVPLLYYSGYQAIDKEGNALPLSYGTQQVIRVIVPAGYAGEIRIAFIPPLSWRVAEVLSLLSWIFFLGKLWIDRKKRIFAGQIWRTQSE
ncbi:MAG: hypothetical protein K6G23_01900, partial [Lachnospiraceae bacterium]|nr:hypothetical protein [Lachnospiraceae bacterium]